MSRLSADAIRAGIAGRVGAYLDALEVFDTIDSTNSYLLGAEAPGIGRCRVALAEVQTAGRGRRSRRWLSPRGAGVYLSLAYTFPRRQQGLPSLALAIGCGVARLLQEFGARDIGLKWPNDVLSGGAKLCGILSEVAPANREGLTVVIGVGLNVNLAAAEGESPAEAGAARVTDLAACCDEAPARGDIAAALVDPGRIRGRGIRAVPRCLAPLRRPARQAGQDRHGQGHRGRRRRRRRQRRCAAAEYRQRRAPRHLRHGRPRALIPPRSRNEIRETRFGTPTGQILDKYWDTHPFRDTHHHSRGPRSPAFAWGEQDLRLCRKPCTWSGAGRIPVVRRCGSGNR